MSRRALIGGGGVVVAGGLGYYFYQAGGNPKTAEKKFESDVTKLSSDAKSKLPGKGKEVEQDAKLSASKVGSKIDGTIDDVKNRANKFEKDAQNKAEEAKKEAEKARKDTGANLNKAVDKFDSSVTEGTSKAKSGISSWFGGGK